jgi:hypothetical protein
MAFPEERQRRRKSSDFVAAEDAAALFEGAASAVDAAVGVDWYARGGTEVDRAAFTLCRLRRARAGEKGGPFHGDEAVRAVLGDVSAPALVWLASRALSYMDESGFPEAVEEWFPELASALER